MSMPPDAIPLPDKYRLRNIGLQAWICQSNCADCNCPRVVADVLEAKNLSINEVLNNNVSPELWRDIRAAKEAVGERVVEWDDFVEIKTYNPLPESVLKLVPDDEL